MPFPVGAGQFAAGTTSGGVALFAQQPTDMDDESLRAPRIVTAGAAVISGLDGVRLIWGGASETFMDALADHYAAARAQGGFYYLKYYKKTSKAYVTEKCVMEEPRQKRVQGRRFFEVTVDFLHLGIA